MSWWDLALGVAVGYVMGGLVFTFIQAVADTILEARQAKARRVRVQRLLGARGNERNKA
jgi:hypothetical protein